MIALWGIIAIVGGQVHPVDGPVIEGGTVIIEGDRITAVGTGLAVPAGATVIDATGKVVTPGLIDAWTQLGLVEVRAVALANDTEATAGRQVYAGRRATDSYNPHSAIIPVQRAHGVTTVLTAPSGGVVSGQAAVFDLAEGEPVAPVAAVVVRLGGRAEGARDESLATLRELVDDARLYARNRAAYDKGQFRASAAHRLDLEAMIPVVEGRVPLAVVVNRVADIRALLRFAADEKLKLVLVDAVEAWRLAEEIAAAKVPVVVQAWINVPVDFDRLHTREDAAERLRAAGVAVSLSTFSEHNVRKLRQWAGNAVRSGMKHADALAAVTRVPAETLSLRGRGVLAPGAVANVVVWSGDPFELSTQVERVLIRGAAVDLMHRQRALFERYRDEAALRTQ